MQLTQGKTRRAATVLCTAALIAQGAAAAPDYAKESLYSGPEPKPGPSILYTPAPRAPQLENTGVWSAAPILISGASAYRKGEYLYQDFIYDDHGANGVEPDPNDPRLTGNSSSRPGGTYTYPSDPVYAGNAADLVELRVKPHGNETAFRVTLNSLHDAERVAFTIAIGDSATSHALPYGANAHAPAQFFLTVHGTQAELRDTATGELVQPAPTVIMDMERRQFEVRVSNTAWDPAGQAVRLAAGVGLWDTLNNRYLLPAYQSNETTPGGAGLLTTPTAFFNVAFRYDEGIDSSWRDDKQADALARGDLSPFFTVVDFGKLKGGTNDDMLGQPKGTPQHGPMNRILASHFEIRQGADFANECGSSATSCEGALLGQLQPYAIYVPKQPRPADGYGLTLLLHSLGANYNQYLGSRNQSQLGERGQGHIVITPAGRGPDGWYIDHAAADTFEVWADVARHYKLDPAMTSISGYSMGGHGTFKFAARYPDLFAKAFSVVGPPAMGIWAPPAEPTGGDWSNTYNLLPGVRNIPFMMWVGTLDELVPYSGTSKQAQRFQDLGYRYEFYTFETSDHLLLSVNDEYEPGAAFLGDAVVNRNPHHVTYVLNPTMDYPDVGLVGDHAYWVSGLTVRDSAVGNGRGTIDVVSHGFGLGEPGPSGKQVTVGVLEGGNVGPLAYTNEFQTWSSMPPALTRNRLDIAAENVATVTVDTGRAKVGCDVALNVTTDGPLTVTLAGCAREAHFQ